LPVADCPESVPGGTQAQRGGCPLAGVRGSILRLRPREGGADECRAYRTAHGRQAAHPAPGQDAQCAAQCPDGAGSESRVRQHGRAIADWPTEDIVGLWRLLARRGNQLGGLSVPRFLRMIGKDTFVTTADVLAALVAMGVLDRAVATSQRDLATVQQAFNQLVEQSGLPLCQLSVMLAFTVNH